MGKKKRSSGFISNNERPNVSKTTLKEMRREYLKSSERLSNQWDAFQRGKRVMVIILRIKWYYYKKERNNYIHLYNSECRL